MSITDRLRNQAGRARGDAPLGHRIAFYAAALTATVSALRLAFNLGRNYGVFRSLEGNHLSCCVNFLESYLIPITGALAVAAVGLWTRKRSGLWLSALALLGVLGLYARWHFGTLSQLRAMEVEDFSRLHDQGQNLLTLLNATWWDVAVLATAVALLGWHVKALLTPARNIR